MYTFRKEKKENKFASHVSNLTFFSFFNKQNLIIFLRKLKETKQTHQKQTSVFILQPASHIYKSFKKNNSKSCVSSPPPIVSVTSLNTSPFTDFVAAAQHHSQTENQERAEQCHPARHQSISLPRVHQRSLSAKSCLTAAGRGVIVT